MIHEASKEEDSNKPWYNLATEQLSRSDRKEDAVYNSYKSLNDINNLVAAFNNCTLPRSQWTHPAHLTVAFWYLTNYDEQKARDCICEGIKKYNTAIGIQNTKDSGYHETITLFWILIVQKFLLTTQGDFIHLANKLINTYDKNLPFQYYSRNLLLSWEARTSWVKPDLKSLSKS